MSGTSATTNRERSGGRSLLPAHIAWTSVTVGLVAAALSLVRLWLRNPEALTQVLWAEDGLFPLCVRKAGFGACLTDPFAGYLLLLPRTLAGVVAAVPPDTWALAANLLAAGVVGAVSGLAFAAARRFGIGWLAALALGLLPAAAPVVAFESLNTLGSSYMLLLYLGIVAVALQPQPIGRWSGTLMAALLLLTALTIPTAVIMVGVIVVQMVRRSIPRNWGAGWVAVLLLGLVAQGITALNAPATRSIEISGQAIDGWVRTVPTALLTMWPGLNLNAYELEGSFLVYPFAWTGWLVVIAMVAVGSYLVVRGDKRRAAVGLLMLSGLAAGAIPTITGGASNRYLVVPALLWGAALLVAVDPWLSRARPWVVVVLIALVGLVWLPSLPASSLRATPAPAWSDELERVTESCTSRPDGSVKLVFTPNWPGDSPEWQGHFVEPTHPDAPCQSLNLP